MAGPRNTVEAFWARVDVRGPDECWPWTGALNRAGGYGHLSWGGRTIYAHRLAHTLRKGPIPEGMQILHACDNPLCCNPAHLSAGTQAENIADMVAKGRHAVGERNARTKLTDEQVEAIRKDPRTQSVIAAEYGIRQSLVSMIKAGKRRPDLKLVV